MNSIHLSHTTDPKTSEGWIVSYEHVWTRGEGPHGLKLTYFIFLTAWMVFVHNKYECDKAKATKRVKT